MIYRIKIGNDDFYKEYIGSNIAKLIEKANSEIKENNTFKILEIRDSKNKLIDLQEYKKRQNRVKRADKEGYMNKDTIDKCYRSIQQSMWYKYDKDKYEEIKIELKKIKDSSKNVDEFKEKVQNYIVTL